MLKIIKHITRKQLVMLGLVATLLLTSCTAAQVSTGWPGVSVDKGIAYVAGGNQVFAVKIGGDKPLWRYPEKADGTNTFYSPPVLVNGKVVVGSYQNILYSLDPTQIYQVEDGKKDIIRETWSNKDGRGPYVAGAALLNNTILAPSADHFLYGLSLQGSKQSSFETGHAIWSQPVTDGKNVYMASMDHHLYGLNPTNFKEIWPKVDLGAAVPGGMVLSKDNILYVGTVAGEVIAANAVSGRITGRFKASSGVWSKPVLDNGILYVGDIDGNFYAINAENMTEKWKRETGGAITGAADLTSKGVVVGNEKGSVILFSLTGERLWTKTVSGQIYTAPVFSKECEFTQGSPIPCVVVAVKHEEKSLYAYDLDGNEKWFFNTPK